MPEILIQKHSKVKLLKKYKIMKLFTYLVCVSTTNE